MATHLGVAHHARLTGDEAIERKSTFRFVTILTLVEMEPTLHVPTVDFTCFKCVMAVVSLLTHMFPVPPHKSYTPRRGTLTRAI